MPTVFANCLEMPASFSSSSVNPRPRRTCGLQDCVLIRCFPGGHRRCSEPVLLEREPESGHIHKLWPISRKTNPRCPLHTGERYHQAQERLETLRFETLWFETIRLETLRLETLRLGTLHSDTHFASLVCINISLIYGSTTPERWSCPVLFGEMFKLKMKCLAALVTLQFRMHVLVPGND